MRVLLIEDNVKLAQHIRTMLERESYSVDCEHDGEAGERAVRATPYDLIVLDIMLPKKNGIAVCADLRKDGIYTPILMMTARGEVDDRVEGLDSGADDYVVKPFDMKELLARVRALLRRPKESVGEIFSAQDVALSTSTRAVTQKGKKIALTIKEYAVLEYLLRNKGRTVTRDELLHHCWDFSYDPFSNITDAYIKQLRKKLHDTNEKYISTVRGVGYTFNA
ncbi:response regulator transcription factor [Candidatus Campbellbacteria bacterium]|nr:MAG: response regulator transcription factor [Candidatus Campbellbacteria bacterium]